MPTFLATETDSTLQSRAARVREPLPDQEHREVGRTQQITLDRAGDQTTEAAPVVRTDHDHIAGAATGYTQAHRIAV